VAPGVPVHGVVPVLAQLRNDFIWPEGVTQTLDVDPMSLV